MPSQIRIATRASQLALWQAHYVSDLLRQSHTELDVELIEVSTQGDRDQTNALQQFGGLGVFTREVQKAVLDGRADIAVHSLKDLPTESAEGLQLAAVPERGPLFDALVLPKRALNESCRIDSLPTGTKIGTGSVRRQAQLLHHRDDLQLLDIRGNVETRLRKLDDGEYDAIILAEAGLRRLEFENRITCRLQPPLMFPAVGQGALGIECRSDDQGTAHILSSIAHAQTFFAVRAERSLLSTLRAGCHAPVGVYCELRDDNLSLQAVVLSHDGRQKITAESMADDIEPESLGGKVARLLLDQGADALVNPSDDGIVS